MDASRASEWDKPWRWDDHDVLGMTSTPADSVYQVNTAWALEKSDSVLSANLQRFRTLIHIVEQKYLRKQSVQGRRLLARLRVAEAAVRNVKEGRGEAAEAGRKPARDTGQPEAAAQAS